MSQPIIPLLPLSRLLADRKLSSREATDQCLTRIGALDGKIRSFVCVEPEAALAAADTIDRRRAAGESLSPMAGIPVGIKDVLCTTDMPTTCGSKMLQDYRSPFDAFAVERLRHSGAIVVGKTNLDQFAMGGSTETSVAGPSYNPWDETRTCGGSSGGSAAAVSAGLVPLTLGTDTGGSIRQPSAFCGVCGLKPTYGRVSRYGLIAYASSLDQAGPIAHTVADLAIALQTIAGHDRRDSTCLDHPVPDYLATLEHPIRPLRIGIIRDHLDGAGLDPEIHQAIIRAIDVYKSLGATIVDIALPHTKYSIATYYIIAPCEASSNLSRFDGAHFGYRAPAARTNQERTLLDMYCRSRSEGFGVEVQRRIMLGTYALSEGYFDAFYMKALKVRRLIRQDYDRAFEQVDALVGPTTPTPPFKIGEIIDDPVQMYLQDLYTVGANLAGIPAMSIPIGTTSSGLPIGMQLQSPPLSEASLLAIGHAYQRAIDYQPTIAPACSS